MTRKRTIVFGIVLLLVGIVAYSVYQFYLVPTKNLLPIYLIPKDAVYIVETEEPVDNWEEISASEVWHHLNNNAYFAELTSNANALDTLFKENKSLFKLIGSRSLMVSAHMYKRQEYDFLFVVDLQKVAKLTQLKNYLNTILSDGFRVSRREYHGEEIIELYDKESRETLYMSFIENLLVCSYTHTLLEASIDQYGEPVIGRDIDYIEISKKVGQDDMFRLYLQYRYLDDYAMAYMSSPNEYLQNLSEHLLYSGFTFALKKNSMIVADGYTNVNEDSVTYLSVLQSSGKGSRSISGVAPQRTAFYMSLGFDSFSEFYENFVQLKEEEGGEFTEHRKSLAKMEKFLKIRIKENFIDWIDDEIAFLQMQASGLGKKNEFAIVLKAKNGDEAKENLDYIIKQIKRKTPVKFKQVTYKGYPINFMSIKGFFKLLLGKFFADLEKPYFTVIDDYVVFSNHPQTLKNVINDFNAENTLSSSPDYNAFNNYFDKKSNLFAYINTPLLHKNLKMLADKETRSNLEKNKEYITCFSQIGFQLTPSGSVFESKLVLQYQDPEVLDRKLQFASRPEKLLLEKFGPSFHNEPLDIAVADVTLLKMVEEEEIIKVEEINPEDLDAKVYTETFEDGTLKIEVSLKDGLKHGTYREYHPNGAIKLKGKYKRDKQVGLWKAYDQEGNTLERKRYR